MTPRRGIEALLDVEKFDGSIWECACGDGAISRVLVERGHHVISTDLVDRGYGTPGVDFLLDTTIAADNIVTNPPYRLGNEFALKALSIARRKVAMLMRLAWLEGEHRRRVLFDPLPPARVWVFSRRLTIVRRGESTNGGGMIAFAWFVWDRDHHGATTIGWI